MEISETIHRLAVLMPVETIDIYIEAETLFDRLSYSEHLIVLDEVGDNETYTGTDLNNIVRGIYITALTEIAAEYGISITETMSVDLSFLIRFILALENCTLTDNKDIIDSITRVDDNIVTLASLVSAISDLEKHEILQNVIDVESGLLDKLFRVEGYDTLDNTQQMATLKRFKSYIHEGRGGITFNYVKTKKYLPVNFKQAYGVLEEDFLALPTDVDFRYEFISLLMASEYSNDVLVSESIRLAEELTAPEWFIKNAGRIASTIKEYLNDQV